MLGYLLSHLVLSIALIRSFYIYLGNNLYTHMMYTAINFKKLLETQKMNPGFVFPKEKV